MAMDVSSQRFPLCATSHNNSRSVLPGRGRGITEESITATENNPMAPRCVSQCGRSGGCARGTVAFAGLRTKALIPTYLCVRKHGFRMNGRGDGRPRARWKLLPFPCRLQTSVVRARRSDSPENQKHYDDQQNQPQSAGWVVSPASAMRPPRQGSKKREYQNND